MAIAKVLTSWTVSINGISYLGRCESIELPTVKEITEDIIGCGLYVKSKVSVGLEPMSSKFVFLEIDPFIFNTYGLAADTVGVICKGALRNDKEVTSLTAIMHGRWEEISMSELKAGQISGKVTATMSVKRYELFIGAIPALIVDAELNILNLKDIGDTLGKINIAMGIA
jgi:uncharacterized protein